ncbi:MAG: hypothetical protein M1813_005435 [Trichoglossum hirsutum]|nr:MAG: hypothetical protein M1813_005435 [Trichoglossum hirsutum]
MSSGPLRVKLIVSSRNWPDIEKDLDAATQKVRLCLELNEKSVSTAVDTYIQFKVDWLAGRNKYNNTTREDVQHYLSLNANSTFLWVALVCQELANIPRYKAQKKLREFPPGLDAAYRQMVNQIYNSEDTELCKRILAVVLTVYRPVTLDELASFVDTLNGVSGDYEAEMEIIGLCGSFLTLRERTVFFVHQSAKDFLLEKASNEIFPSGMEDIHNTICSQSLQAMSETLRRDVYKLSAPAFDIDQVKKPDPDPLVATRYSCVYWIHHLCDCSSSRDANDDVQDGGSVDRFLRQHYLHWLEALSLCRTMSERVRTMAKLEALIQGRVNAPSLIKLIRDAHRFIMYHKWAIENSPLQAYVSALVFSPARSLVKGLFKEEEPKRIMIKPAMGDKWSACLQTLEGYSRSVNSVAFSHDSARLASASSDGTVKIWDASSGECLQTLKGHSDSVNSVAFSHDSARLASASSDNTVKIWDASSGECLQALNSHSDSVNSVAFPHDSARLASVSSDRTVKIWDASSGRCLQTFKGHSRSVSSVTFSHDSARLASASFDGVIKFWDASSGECLQTFKGHNYSVNSVTFSHDSAWLASAPSVGGVKIWDVSSGECLQTLKGHGDSVNSVALHHSVSSVAFSYDSARLASASVDGTVKIWDAGSGECLQTLEGHSNSVNSVTFSHNSARLASASDDGTVKIWDAGSDKYLQTLESHSDSVNSVAFSHDSAWLASASLDGMVKIWDASSGECLQTIKVSRGQVKSVTFSHDSTRLASVSSYGTVGVWDRSSGGRLQTFKFMGTSNGGCLQMPKGHIESITSVSFSPDSAWLASASADSTVKIWDASSGECLQTLSGHSDTVKSVVFSDDSARLASASADTTVKIWDTSSGECTQSFGIGKVPFHISFDTTGSYLHTESDTIVLNTSDASSASDTEMSATGPQNPQHQGRALGLDGIWITYNSEKLLWLPSEYRPSCLAMSGKMIGIGTGSGKIWICNLTG